ncbi:tetratricopeptide repeat protein [Ideonella sp.]|uniref:tetratricopeptide repeat protein n=1 Tax=Ideonella sp. TaxID=1929293 RepID=UPI003BB7BEA7
MPSPSPSPPNLRDPRGHGLGTVVAEAAERVEAALWRMMSCAESPWGDLQAAAEADPRWALPLVMQAGHLLGQGDAAACAPARELLARAAALTLGAPARERAHWSAVNTAAEGHWQEACAAWDELLLTHPRDALALHWAHHWSLTIGDTASLRWRPARVLPEWDETDQLFPQVLGLYAFGLQENNLYPQAEDAGRRATASEASVPWAVHAVAHVMDRQGRIEEGTAWLRLHQPAWSDSNAFAGHLWWHMALFRLEALDLPGVHRLIDAHFSQTSGTNAADHIDTVSLLWRLHLMNEDVSARFREVLKVWQPAVEEAGHLAFHDLHWLLALLGAGELARAEAWIARCASRAMQADEARRSNHRTAREVGLPLMRGLLAGARGDETQALTLIQAVRPQWGRLGGCQVQRDLLDQTLLAAAATQAAPIGRALLNERLMSKPATPLTRHWAERLQLAL